MSFCWRGDDGPILNADLVALLFLRGSKPVFLRNPITLCFFRGGGGPPVINPPPPLDSCMSKLTRHWIETVI